MNKAICWIRDECHKISLGDKYEQTINKYQMNIYSRDYTNQTKSVDYPNLTDQIAFIATDKRNLNMAKILKNFAAQGDFIIRRIKEIPKGVDVVKPENGKYVVAHSETGHNHVMDTEGVTAYKPSGVKEADLYTLFFDVQQLTGDDLVEINHLRSFDTHESILVPPGQYEIRRQREYTPEGFRRAAD